MRVTKTNTSLGFTFVELIIVIMIVAIVAAAGVPVFASSVGDAQLTAATNDVAAALQYAQTASMASGRPHRVILDSVGRVVRVELLHYAQLSQILGAATQVNAADVEVSGTYVTAPHPVNRGQSYQLIFANESRLENVTFVTSLAGGGNTVSFNSSGSPSTSGTITLTLRQRQRIVTVAPVTGRVTVSP